MDAAPGAEELAVFAAAASYAVVADSSPRLSPRVQQTPPDNIVEKLRGKRAVFLGEHHNSGPDHQLQAALIRKLRPTRSSMAVGLEAVQQRFQPFLDAYVGGEISEQELETAVEWKKRWFWPFEQYLPVFRACRELTASGRPTPLLALNVDSEDLSKVEAGGLPALDQAVLSRYVPDREGFAAFSATRAFREYVGYVVRPSYDMHAQMGILRNTITGQQLAEDMTFRNFYSGRILWDEAMSSRSAKWLNENPDGLLIGLIGSDHVKFGCGVPARCARQIGSRSAVATVMLNPGVIDTSDNFRANVPTRGGGMATFEDFTLQLRFSPVSGDGGPPMAGAAPDDRQKAFAMSQTRDANDAVLSLADFLIFSKEAPTYKFVYRLKEAPAAVM